MLASIIVISIAVIVLLILSGRAGDVFKAIGIFIGVVVASIIGLIWAVLAFLYSIAVFLLPFAVIALIVVLIIVLL